MEKVRGKFKPEAIALAQEISGLDGRKDVLYREKTFAPKRTAIQAA
ncbi:hypothetical protein [Mesorhizobium sp.]|nr:hypothetical protein [Mesorhizobium sp.]